MVGAPLPWFIPVPVKKSDFRSLFRDHDNLNVESDLSAIVPFDGRPREIGDDRILYADLQVAPDDNLPGRLGSGRSGFYRNFYLKGIGRTTVAANWNRKDDRGHNTGHLPASSAIREYFVSSYLENVGRADLIWPCRGMLVKPLSPNLKDWYPSILKGFPAECRSRLLPCDRALQAITVKPAGFSRISNFVWFLNFPVYRGTLRKFFSLLNQALDPTRGGAAAADSGEGVHPDILVGRLSQTFLLSLEMFRTAFHLGIGWGSMQNNFSVDGRMVDLETAVVLGSPFLGTYSVANHPRPYHHAFGLDVLHYVRQFRRFIDFLIYRSRYLTRCPDTLSDQDRILADHFHRGLKKTFSRGHILFSDKKILEWILEWMGRDLDVSVNGRPRLRTFVGQAYSEIMDHSGNPQGRVAWDRKYFEPVSERPFRPHGFLGSVFDQIKFFPFSAQALSTAVFWDEKLNELYQASNEKELFSRLRKLKGARGPGSD